MKRPPCCILKLLILASYFWIFNKSAMARLNALPTSM